MNKFSVRNSEDIISQLEAKRKATSIATSLNYFVKENKIASAPLILTRKTYATPIWYIPLWGHY